MDSSRYADSRSRKRGKADGSEKDRKLYCKAEKRKGDDTKGTCRHTMRQ